MATRSAIGIELEDGSIRAVYCHSDGYLSHNGRILVENYTNEEDVLMLISLGDMSYLDVSIGAKHDFNKGVKGWTCYYGRDRGEEDVEPKDFLNRDEYLKNFDMGVQYHYLFTKDGWYYSGGYDEDENPVDNFTKLTRELCVD